MFLAITIKETKMVRVPNPGSDDALNLGCECPVMDNGHGKGCGYGTKEEPAFWVNQGCPLHSVDKEDAVKYIQKRAMKRIGL